MVCRAVVVGDMERVKALARRVDKVGLILFGEVQVTRVKTDAEAFASAKRVDQRKKLADALEGAVFSLEGAVPIFFGAEVFKANGNVALADVLVDAAKRRYVSFKALGAGKPVATRSLLRESSSSPCSCERSEA